MQFRFAAFLAFAVSSYTATAKDICFDHNTVDRLVDGMAKLIPEVVGTNGTEQASEKREITPVRLLIVFSARRISTCVFWQSGPRLLTSTAR